MSSPRSFTTLPYELQGLILEAALAAAEYGREVISLSNISAYHQCMLLPMLDRRRCSASSSEEMKSAWGLAFHALRVFSERDLVTTGPFWDPLNRDPAIERLWTESRQAMQRLRMEEFKRRREKHILEVNRVTKLQKALDRSIAMIVQVCLCCRIAYLFDMF
jgi:hypothetical protein